MDDFNEVQHYNKYKYKDKYYRVDGVVKLKDLETGEWAETVLYHSSNIWTCQNNPELEDWERVDYSVTYARELKDFKEKFELIPEENL